MTKDGSVSDRAMGTSNAAGQGELDCAMNDIKICMKYLWCGCYFLDLENVCV